MRRISLLALFLMLTSTYLGAQKCQDLMLDMRLPKKLKTKGKPKVARWADVDRLLNELSEKLQGKECKFTFNQIFRIDSKDVFFPLTNSVIRIVPEDTFDGLPVATKEGEPLGEYAGRFRFEKSGGLYARESISLFYFQYKNPQGQMQQAARGQLLFDSFVVPWDQIQSKTAISTF